MPLYLSDYQRLLELAENRPAAWNMLSKRRCFDAGLVSETGEELTNNGRRKVSRIREVLKQLREGVSLDVPRVDRSAELQQESWRRAKFDDHPCWLSDCALFAGRPPEGFQFEKINGDDEAYKRFKSEIGPSLDARSWVRIDPIAVQRNALESLEVICFSERSSSGFVRIQTKYYDFILNQWPDAEWWLLRTTNGILIAAKASGWPSLRHGFQAVIMPVRASGWMAPEVQPSSVKGEESCPRKTDIETKPKLRPRRKKRSKKAAKRSRPVSGQARTKAQPNGET